MPCWGERPLARTESGAARPYRVGGLVFGAKPADDAVAFFFGALGVGGDEVFEDDVVKPLLP